MTTNQFFLSIFRLAYCSIPDIGLALHSATLNATVHLILLQLTRKKTDFFYIFCLIEKQSLNLSLDSSKIWLKQAILCRLCHLSISFLSILQKGEKSRASVGLKCLPSMRFWIRIRIKICLSYNCKYKSLPVCHFQHWIGSHVSFTCLK